MFISNFDTVPMNYPGNFDKKVDPKDKRFVEPASAFTELESFDLTQIPFSALVRIGQVFKEGETKYGRDNWRNGVFDHNYQRERLNHALKHLLSYIENRFYSKADPFTEDDLAKVAWAVITQMELERLEKKQV